jgi:hypothetical protein
MTQRWKLSYRVEKDRQRKEIQIRNVVTNYTLDILDGSPKNGAQVIAWVNNHDHPNERFTITLVDIFKPIPYALPKSFNYYIMPSKKPRPIVSRGSRMLGMNTDDDYY